MVVVAEVFAAEAGAAAAVAVGEDVAALVAANGEVLGVVGHGWASLGWVEREKPGVSRAFWVVFLV